MNKKIPPPICEICGVKQVDGDNINIIFYTHYGVFCEPCCQRYEWDFKEAIAKVCKKKARRWRYVLGYSKNWKDKILGFFNI